jgi:hypothetical protein
VSTITINRGTTHVNVSVTPTQWRARKRVDLGISIAVVGWSLALYGLTFLVVRRHYQEYPPHYDSIGMFSAMFEIVNELQRQSIATVSASAFAVGLSWLQPAYAMLLAWAPLKSPEGMVSLNLVLLILAQLSILTYARTFDWSPLRQIVAATLPVVPGALYAWDGGIQDMRRDIQLLLLALAILHLSLAYVAAPSWQRGAALGLLVGLAQWSRDNAAAVILIVIAPAIVRAVALRRERGGVPALVRLGLVPMATFAILAVPYYVVTLPLTIERYSTSVWGVGESRLESLLAFWNMPFNVLLGGDSRISGRVRVALVTTALLVAALATTWVLRRRGLVSIDLRRVRHGPFAVLLASGTWVVCAVFLYNTVVLGYGARWHGVPFLPIMVGIIAMLIGLTGVVRWEGPATSRIAIQIVGVGCLVLLVSAPLRMVLNQPKAEGIEGIQNLRSAAATIGEISNGRPVGFLAYDTLSRHHARFYATLAGRSAITEFEPIANRHGDPIDLDQPIRAGQTARQLQQRLDTALRGWAAYVLVYADTARYADPRETLWPYLAGRPVVDRLLSDPTWKPVARFTLRERDLVLLENTAVRDASAQAGLAGGVGARTDGR